MSFFKQFPTIQYDVLERGELIDMKNIFRHVDVNDLGLDGITSYTYYNVVDGERPDLVSQKLYKTPDYYWTFFILNDRLKNGLSAWPKSQQELERFITETYDTHSVVQFIPELSIEEGVNQMFNSFSGIDMTHPYIRIRRKTTNGYALVNEYKVDLLQLFVRDVVNEGSFFNGPDNFVIETYNPHLPSSSEYEDAQVLNDIWLEKMLVWMKKYQNVFYELFVATVDVGLNRRAYLQEFQRIVLQNYLEFYDSGVYDIGRNAPAYYNTADGTDTIGAYTVLKDNPEYPYFTTVYEDEDNKNDALNSIRVVDPAYISIFAEEYKRYINESK